MRGGQHKMRLAAHNVTRGSTLAERCRVANRTWLRLRGLIGKASLAQDEGLWIVPCNGIHTLGMRFPIDVIFLDGNLRVVAVEEAMRPWRLGRVCLRARSVLELPVGCLASSGTQLGDQIAIEEGPVA